MPNHRLTCDCQCSGDRPICARCRTRGTNCQYRVDTRNRSASQKRDYDELLEEADGLRESLQYLQTQRRRDPDQGHGHARTLPAATTIRPEPRTVDAAVDTPSVNATLARTLPYRDSFVEEFVSGQTDPWSNVTADHAVVNYLIGVFCHSEAFNFYIHIPSLKSALHLPDDRRPALFCSSTLVNIVCARACVRRHPIHALTPKIFWLTPFKQMLMAGGSATSTWRIFQYRFLKEAEFLFHAETNQSPIARLQAADVAYSYSMTASDNAKAEEYESMIATAYAQANATFARQLFHPPEQQSAISMAIWGTFVRHRSALRSSHHGTKI